MFKQLKEDFEKVFVRYSIYEHFPSAVSENVFYYTVEYDGGISWLDSEQTEWVNDWISAYNE